MKEKSLEELEKINESKKLSKEVKDRISNKVFSNLIIAIDILVLFMFFMVAQNRLSKTELSIFYKVTSMLLLMLTLVLFEIAYKKDNDSLCVSGIEMLILSIIILLAPYFCLEKSASFAEITGSYYAAYYILKNLYIYKKEKKEYLKEKNDIKEIIKKESKDELAIEFNEKVKQEENSKPAKRAGRPKKEKNEEKIIKEETIKTEKVATKKAGRPRKIDLENITEPKKVGRPKKTDTQNTTPKKVGRPRKTEQKTETEEKPKRVGRPRKTTTTEENTAPRKVGRPRKITQ